MTKANKEGRRKAPILRFKGFTDDWEQRKLGNLFSERKEKSTKGELLSVTLSNGVVKFSDLNKKDNSNIKSGNYKVVKKSDIPYNSMRMWQGASGVSQYNGIVSPAYTVLVPNKNSNSNFYAILFKKESILNLFTRFSQGLTSDTWNLKYPILKDINVPFTNLEEQKRIFKIFNVVNNLLALYERKTRLLSKLRTFLTQRLFSNSSKVSLYFDNKNWSKHKISEFLTERNEKVIPNPSIPLVSFTVEKGVTPKSKRYNREFLVKDDKKKYKITKKNDIVYNPANLKFGAIARNKFGNAAFSPIYVTFITKLNPVFTEFLVRRKDFIKLALKYQEGTVYERMAVKSKDFLSLKIYLPNSSRDINYIAQILQSLDTLVSLNKNKISLITLIKKELLNTMFI